MEASKHLKRYFRVQRNEMSALFKITEKIPVQFDPGMQLEEFKEIHKKGIVKYRKLREKLELEAIDALAHKNASDRLLLLTEIFLKHPKANPSLLDLKIAIMDRILENCDCCGWSCGVNGKTGEKGLCGLTDISNYASEFLHMREEPELIPTHSIFFTGYTFACVYCQN
jgi:putative pyruvate formate lyase activating enzyme